MIAESELIHKLAKFGDYELDCSAGKLSYQGEPVNLEPLIFQFLTLLIRHNGGVVSKQVVLEVLWPNKQPTDEALRAMVKKAREVLKDNARNPTYIKTIPTKGYVLIPNVVLSSTIVQTWYQQYKKLILVSGLFVTLVAILLIKYFSASSNDVQGQNEIGISSTQLGLISDQNVSTHYINKVLSKVLVTNDLPNGTSTVNITQIATSEQATLYFDYVLSPDVWWSALHNTLLVMRNDKLAILTIEFNSNTSKPFITEYPISLADNLSIVGFAESASVINVINAETNQLQLFSLKSGEPIHTIDLLNSDPVHAIVEPIGKVETWANPTQNNYILGIQSNETFSLYLVNSAQNNIAVKLIIKLDGSIQSGVWNQLGDRFSFTNQAGSLFSYSFASNRLTSWNTGNEDTNSLVADCGDGCFVVSDALGLPKLTSIENPFLETQSVAKVATSNVMPRSELLPLHTSEGMYFVSQTPLGSTIMFRDNNNQERSVFTFSEQSVISELTINEETDSLSGIVNERAFIFDRVNNEVEYLNITFPNISHIRFTSASLLHFYGKPSNQPAGIYEYDLATASIRFVSPNLLWSEELTLVDGEAGNQRRHRASFNLSDNGLAA